VRRSHASQAHADVERLVHSLRLARSST
jgi:hypothetical protein